MLIRALEWHDFSCDDRDYGTRFSINEVLDRIYKVSIGFDPAILRPFYRLAMIANPQLTGHDLNIEFRIRGFYMK